MYGSEVVSSWRHCFQTGGLVYDISVDMRINYEIYISQKTWKRKVSEKPVSVRRLVGTTE